MINKIREAAAKYNMFDSVGTVTVALSGGADSVSLLHALLCIKDEFGFKVNAAHLNHLIRGDEADSDEQFVKDLCKELNVELFCERACVPKIAEESGESLELAARKVRYEFLTRVAEGVVATAHTASDNIETLLFNVSRGTGLKGLCGIPAKRDNIIRPLVLATREDVIQYCAENNLSFCTDSTNSDVNFARNRIRHNVVPELIKVNEGAVQNALRLCNNLSKDADFIDGFAESAYKSAFADGGLLLETLKLQHIAIKVRMIARLCENISGLKPEEVHIKTICDMLEFGKNRASFKGDFEATVRKGILRIEKIPTDSQDFEITVDAFPFEFENVSITKNVFEKKEKLNSLLLKNTLDCDKICGELVLRNRKPGDEIKLNGRNVTKTLKKLFNEADMSAQEKAKALVLCDEKGVIWVQNFGVSQRVSVDESTKCVIIVGNNF